MNPETHLYRRSKMKVLSGLKASAVVGVALAACLASAAQSLGDAARKAQANKAPSQKHAKVVTNDDLADPNRIVRPPESLASDSALNQRDAGQNSDSTDSANKGDEAQKTGSDSEQDAQKAEGEAKTKIADQKSKIDLLQREIDVM